MIKTSYANLKLKVNTEVKSVDYKGNVIEVLQYLPIDDKSTGLQGSQMGL